MSMIQLLDAALTLMALDAADSDPALYLFLAYLLTRESHDRSSDD